MDHTPVEVLQEIFSRLDLKDKLACMLVCRFWYNTLDRSTLLCNIFVRNGRFGKLKDMLERFPHRAAQVEYLTLHERLEPTFDKRELCNMFPNLREFNYDIYPRGKLQTHTNESFQYLHTTCKLNKLVEAGGCEFASQIAMSNLGCNLKTLELDFKMFDVRVDMSDISQLKNLPVLEELRLMQLTFKLMNLEVLHSNLPSIKILHLKVAHLVSGEIPRDVAPASLVTELKVQMGQPEDLDTHIQLYKYISKKYPYVKNPIIEDDMETNEEGLGSIPDVYNEGILPLYRNIGPHVDTFSFGEYCPGLDAFRKFDDYGMKLKELKIRKTWQFDDVPFMEELTKSQQSKCIQELTLHDTIPEPINMTRNMEALETLNISCNFILDFDLGVMRKDINLTQLIDACPPTLNSLMVDNLNLTYDGPTSNITSVKDLTITFVEYTPLLATIIETSFPQLSTLTLAGDINSNVTISLLNHNLQEAYITAMYDEHDERNDYSSESKYENGVHCHIIKRTPDSDIEGELYTFDRGTNSAVEKDPKKSYALKFICPSVEKVFFCINQKAQNY